MGNKVLGGIFGMTPDLMHIDIVGFLLLQTQRKNMTSRKLFFQATYLTAFTVPLFQVQKADSLPQGNSTTLPSMKFPLKYPLPRLSTLAVILLEKTQLAGRWTSVYFMGLASIG